MNASTLGTASRCLPRTFASKAGRLCTLQLLCGAGQRLLDMYLAFQPRNCFQGLPPIKDAVCIKWVEDMLRTGVNVIALCGSGEKGDRHILPERPSGCCAQNVPVPFLAATETIVGHCALFPINPRKCEMLVVVCPKFQNLGIGTELVKSCIDLADELSFERIWLPVDAANVRARHVYRKCGFEYLANQQGREMDMACEVRRHSTRAIAAPPFVSAPHIQLGADMTGAGCDYNFAPS